MNCRSKYCPFSNTTMNTSLATSLPTFSGSSEDNIEYFLDQFNSIANLENWDKNKKLILLKLNCKGDALKYLMNDPSANKETDFNNLETLLKNKFKRKQETFQEIQQKFSKIKHLPNQTISDLAEVISEYATKYINKNNSSDPAIVELTENIKLTKFLDALRADLKCEVKKLGPKNFNEAVRIAKNIENAISETPNTNSSYDLQINTLLQQQLESNKIIQELSSKLNNLPTANVNAIASTSNNLHNSETVKCHICYKNHLTTKCWNFPGNRNPYHQNNFNSRGNYNRHPTYFRSTRGNFRRGRNNVRPYYRDSERRNLN